jgi:hypothetical protein
VWSVASPILSKRVRFCPIDENLNPARDEVCTEEAGVGVDACDDLDFMIP